MRITKTFEKIYHESLHFFLYQKSMFGIYLSNFWLLRYCLYSQRRLLKPDVNVNGSILEVNFLLQKPNRNSHLFESKKIVLPFIVCNKCICFCSSNGTHDFPSLFCPEKLFWPTTCWRVQPSIERLVWHENFRYLHDHHGPQIRNVPFRTSYELRLHRKGTVFLPRFFLLSSWRVVTMAKQIKLCVLLICFSGISSEHCVVHFPRGPFRRHIFHLERNFGYLRPVGPIWQEIDRPFVHHIHEIHTVSRF